MKEIKIENLVKVSNYARKKKKSVVHVYKQLEEGKLDLVEIDGVKFVNDGR